MKKKRVKAELYLSRYLWLKQELELFPDSLVSKVAKKEMDDIERYIDNITEEDIKKIIKLKYMEGLTYLEIQEEMYSTAVFKKLQRFFKKINAIDVRR